MLHNAPVTHDVTHGVPATHQVNPNTGRPINPPPEPHACVGAGAVIACIVETEQVPLSHAAPTPPACPPDHHRHHHYHHYQHAPLALLRLTLRTRLAHAVRSG